MSKYAFFAFNIIAIALPLALLEIYWEGDKGWGSGMNKNRWFAKPFGPNSSVMKFIVKVINIENPLNYHVFVFVATIPLILLAEYIYFHHPPLVFVSSYFGILLAEDFLWFLFNWHFDSLRQLLRGPNGSIWWHKRWIKISPKHYLPAAYLTGLALSLFFLWLA